jgi:hypothetical protein
MDSLESSRRQSQNLISKTGTLSWTWCANEQIEYKSFKVYSQLIMHGVFYLFSKSWSVDGSWETKVGFTDLKPVIDYLAQANPPVEYTLTNEELQ